MPQDSDESKLRQDTNEIAERVARAALGEAERPQPPGARAKHPEAVKRGRKGGKKGGGGRAKQLSPKERSDIARRAARRRWGKGEA